MYDLNQKRYLNHPLSISSTNEMLTLWSHIYSDVSTAGVIIVILFLCCFHFYALYRASYFTNRFNRDETLESKTISGLTQAGHKDLKSLQESFITALTVVCRNIFRELCCSIDCRIFTVESRQDHGDLICDELRVVCGEHIYQKDLKLVTVLL